MFYVYQLRIEDQDKPFYVGKGQGQRAYYHLKADCINNDSNRHKVHTILKARRDGKEVLVEFLFENLSEQDALNKEIEIITHYGRRNNGTGILTNLTDGGDGVSGFRHSKETRERLSRSAIKYAKMNPDEFRRQCVAAGVAACRTMWDKNRANNMERVKRQSKENYDSKKDALLEGIKRFNEDEEARSRCNKKISEAMSSEKNRILVGKRTSDLFNDPKYRNAVFPPFHRSPRYLKPKSTDLETRQNIMICLDRLYNFWVENGKRTFSFYHNPNSIGFKYDNALLIQPIKQFQRGYNPLECDEYIEWSEQFDKDDIWMDLSICNKRL